jgi:mRNA (2'-O-methyladenosine-N6-)-methyltransferase
MCWVSLTVVLTDSTADVAVSCRFDVVLIDPPWEEYVRRAPGFIKDQDSEVWSWQHIMDLDIGAIADNPSFVFL